MPQKREDTSRTNHLEERKQKREREDRALQRDEDRKESERLEKAKRQKMSGRHHSSEDLC